MNKKIVLYLLFTTCFAFSQKEASVWYFGTNAGIKFNDNGTVTTLTDGQLNTSEGCATIADVNGDLLFYTDGITVWNHNHQVMQNGTGLMGNPSTTQSATIVPLPGSSTLYYVFTLDSQVHQNGFQYSIIDISLNGGLGAVTSDKNVLVYTPSDEKISVVKHANTNDYWVVTHGWNSNAFHSYLLSASGLNSTPVTSNTGISITGSTDNVWGYMKISPDGSKLATAHALLEFELMDFDNATGIVSNAQALSGLYIYGVEFSPDSQLLYATVIDPSPYKIIQYNLNATDIPASAQVFTIPDIIPTALQLGPDGRIYIGQAFTSKLGVISNPNIIGTGCNLQMNFIDLAGRYCQLGLPPFITSFFDASFTVENLCLGSPTAFDINSNQTPTSVLWDFGDGFTSFNFNTSHQYANAGTYIVTLTATSANGTSTKSKTITISPLPVVANAISNPKVCGSANMVYDLSQFNTLLLGSQSTSAYGVAYFSSLSDANNHTGQLNTAFTLPLGTTPIVAKVYNLANPDCHSTTNFTITNYSQPTAYQPADYVICENLPYNSIEQFDLSTKNTEIFNGQSSSVFSISYHTNQNDANNGNNDLPVIYSNSNPQETIFARIENNSNPLCFDTVFFDIKVIQQPVISQVNDFYVCDDANNDGIATFDLSQKNSDVLNGQPSAIFEVHYYPSQQNADDDSNEIISAIDNTVNNQPVFYVISAIGNDNCKASGSFNLVVYAQPTAHTANPLFICDDVLNDGFGTFSLENTTQTIIGNQDASQYSVSYHLNQSDASAGANGLPLHYPNTSNPQTIYARIQNNQNQDCFDITSFEIGLYKMPMANQPLDLFECDDESNDGKVFFDLTLQDSAILGLQSATDFDVSYYLSPADANSGTNAISSSYEATTTPLLIYARIENRLSGDCFDMVSFELNIKAKPELNLQESYSICEGKSITITASSGFDTYSWSNGSPNASTTITESGNYSLTVTKDYGDIVCDATKNIVVYNSNVATITNIDTVDWSDNQNRITVHVTGDGAYEYSIDGSNYQDSPDFFGIESGQHIVYVNDKRDCGIATQEIFLLMYPRFFTPNGDGYNDTWKIQFSIVEPNMRLTLFDRYGKVITRFNGNSFGWDGTLNGKPLPSTDYWFVVDRENGKEYRGHFALKR